VAELYSSRVQPTCRLSVEAKWTVCSYREAPFLHRHFTSLSLISLRLWFCAVFIWAWACALVISAMEDPPVINSVRNRAFNDPRNCSTQATPFTSGPMTDLLRGSLGDSRYSDNGSNRYQHGQYGLLSGNYMNKRNSAFEAHPELSLPSPPLRSPFDSHRDATSLDPTAHSHDTSGTTAMRTQVSAPSVFGYYPVTNNIYYQVDTL
jgi:hypothetical protein